MNLDKKIFFNEYKNTIDPDRKLSQQEVNAINVFIDMVEQSWNKLSLKQWAYVFATTFHETAHTFLPVKEAYWMSEDWRKKNLRYWPYFGRGFCQCTWLDNYKYYSKILNVDLVKNPDLALNPKYAFEIMIHGFINGTFSKRKVNGKYVPNKISDFINSEKTDYVNARKCINLLDKAKLIANYANTFEKILQKSFNM